VSKSVRAFSYGMKLASKRIFAASRFDLASEAFLFALSDACFLSGSYGSLSVSFCFFFASALACASSVCNLITHSAIDMTACLAVSTAFLNSSNFLSTVGCDLRIVGPIVGIRVVGVTVGTASGAEVGGVVATGADVGVAVVGPTVGGAVGGAVVGFAVGGAVCGAVVGFAVGGAVCGAVVGFAVGGAVCGAVVGFAVGGAVGGAVVGFAVGGAVCGAVVGPTVGGAVCGAVVGPTVGGAVCGAVVGDDIGV
jgi:hypothetical protein